MTTETLPVVTNLNEMTDRLRSDIENIHRELDQALGVWRVTLSDEKQDFQKLLQSKEQHWDGQESQWQAQRAAYEQKLLELETHFQNQLVQTERNAVQALNQLDDAWQWDKLRWGNENQQRLQESEARETTWTLERQDLLKQIEDLHPQALANTLSTEAVQKHFEQLWARDKAQWERTLQETLQRLDEQQTLLKTEQARRQQQLTALEQQLALAQPRPGSAGNPFIEPCLRSLESQVATLDALFREIIEHRAEQPAHAGR